MNASKVLLRKNATFARLQANPCNNSGETEEVKNWRHKENLTQNKEIQIGSWLLMLERLEIYGSRKIVPVKFCMNLEIFRA